MEDLQYEMANLVTQQSELEDALVTISEYTEQQKKVVAAATPPPPVNNKSDVEKLFAAFLSGQKLPEVPSKPSTSGLEKKLQEVLDGTKDKTRNVCRSKKLHKLNIMFIVYCGSHGCNKIQNNCGCKNKNKFQDDNSTFANPNTKTWHYIE